MRKRLRIDRVMVTGIFIALCLSIFIYMFFHRNHYYVYDGYVETLVASYSDCYKVYTFDLKSFYEDGNYYVSLNDMYNMMLILDPDTQVYLNQNKHILVYNMSDIIYTFDYGQGKLLYGNDCIDLKNIGEKIYISNKNIYVSVGFVEKTLLNNRNKIKIENKNAIIQ